MRKAFVGLYASEDTGIEAVRIKHAEGQTSNDLEERLAELVILVHECRYKERKTQGKDKKEESQDKSRRMVDRSEGKGRKPKEGAMRIGKRKPIPIEDCGA